MSSSSSLQLTAKLQREKDCAHNFYAFIAHSSVYSLIVLFPQDLPFLIYAAYLDHLISSQVVQKTNSIMLTLSCKFFYIFNIKDVFII